MTAFQVGDRVKYVNTTMTSCRPAVNQIGTIIRIDRTEVIVEFDTPCWEGKRKTGSLFGLWKWELVETTNPQQRILNKIKSLEQRFKNKTLPKTTMKPLALPR